MRSVPADLVLRNEKDPEAAAEEILVTKLFGFLNSRQEICGINLRQFVNPRLSAAFSGHASPGTCGSRACLTKG